MKHFKECTKQEKARRIHMILKNCNCSDELYNKYYDYIDFKSEDELDSIYAYVQSNINNLNLCKHDYYLQGNRKEYQ